MKYLINDIRNSLIKIAYRNWQQDKSMLEDGYTIILPSPADIPAFIYIALEVISKQDLTGLKEVIIVPDWPSKRFNEISKELSKQYSNTLRIRTVQLTPVDRVAWHLTKSITTRHFTQLVRGLDATTTQYAIIHDSDLFLPPGTFLREQYESCRERGLAVYGLEQRRSMIREDRVNFVATWEMTLSVNWAKSFPPHAHKGQISVINGRRQEFDTTLLPQYLTPAELCDIAPTNGRYFHFRYVIATYRNFVNKKELEPLYGLKLFLIRTLVDVFDKSGFDYVQLPKHEEYLEGKFGLSALRDYENGARWIAEFKTEYSGILEANIFEETQLVRLRQRFEELVQSLDYD